MSELLVRNFQVTSLLDVLAALFSRGTHGQCAVRRLAQFIALTFALLCSVISHSAFGFVQQWQWKVTGISQTFESKQAALSYFRSQSNAMQHFTIEEFQGMNAGWVTYKYTAPRKDPIVKSDWVYHGGGSASYATEAEFVAVKQAGYAAQTHSACPQPVVTPDGEWANSQSWYGIPIQGYRPYRVTNRHSWSDTLAVCIQQNDMADVMYRRRDAGCPSSYSVISTAPHCHISGSITVSGHFLEQPNECGNVGNPCNVATGTKTQVESDYIGAGLALRRTYQSQTLESAHGLGVGWTHSYAHRLLFNGTTPSGLSRPSGNHEALRNVTTNHYISESGTGSQLKKAGTEWFLYLNSGNVEAYDSTGKLVRLVTAGGETTVLSYANGRLSTVIGPYGHTLQFIQDSGRYSYVIDPAGEFISFAYDAAGNLTQVTYPNGTSRSYNYENSAFPNHLTGVTDETGTRFATFDYDSIGRATLTKHAGHTDQYTLIYNSNSTIVTDPLGAVITYQFSTEDRARRIVSRSISGLTQSFTVPSYATDFQRRTTQEIDARGIVTRVTYDRDHLRKV